MFEAFKERNFAPKTLALIDQANSIISELQKQGFTLTLRQLYYQFVSRDLMENKQTEYKRLGSILNDARIAGLVDWSAIEDRTRNVRKMATWDSPAEIIQAVSQQYKQDLWADQEYVPEVWIEKDALIGVVEPVCNKYRVPLFACRGNVSVSELYGAGKRFADVIESGRVPVVLHLGDHDPNGLDMTRDNADRMSLFAGQTIDVRRLALNMDQVRRYNPPPNPAKETDSRFDSYVATYGTNSSWELDALDPRVIDKIIEDELKNIIDRQLWAQAKTREDNARDSLVEASDNWEDVQDYLKTLRDL